MDSGLSALPRPDLSSQIIATTSCFLSHGASQTPPHTYRWRGERSFCGDVLTIIRENQNNPNVLMLLARHVGDMGRLPRKITQ